MPPDPTGAVGPTDAIETVNATIGFYNRATPTQPPSTSPLSSFYINKTNYSFSDPHTIYDQIGGHYVVVAMSGVTGTNGTTTPTDINVAVSLGNNTSSGWCNYTIPGGYSGSPAGSPAIDYPLVGVDNNSVKLSDNVYSDSSLTQQTDARVFILPRTQVEACKNIKYTYFSNVRDPGTAPCPLTCTDQLSAHVAPITDANPTGHTNDFVASYPFGGAHVSYFFYNGSGLQSFQVSTPSYNKPNSATQQGSTAVPQPGYVDTGYSDIKQAVRWGDASDEVFVTLTSKNDWGGGNVNSTVLWLSLILDPSGSSTENSLQFGYPGYWYFYPSAVPDKSGNALLNFSVSGSSTYPGDAVASITFNLGVSGPTLYPGSGPTTVGSSKNCTSTPCYRYGDFTSVGLDPLNHAYAYVTGELQGTGNLWQTLFEQISN